KHDIQEFEALRTKLCDELINSAPTAKRRRLRGIQFQVDMERRRAATPLAACIRISEMMHSSFDELRYALNEASGAQSSVPIHRTAKRADARNNQRSTRVIHFPGS
ncbi:MAG: DUF3135 domain-containing protein, partial [Pseudomonadales bacterium]|nr:DUF3135 domain-containing protein [Pseudomonadales bacterium]